MLFNTLHFMQAIKNRIRYPTLNHLKASITHVHPQGWPHPHLDDASEPASASAVQSDESDATASNPNATSRRGNHAPAVLYSAAVVPWIPNRYRGTAAHDSWCRRTIIPSVLSSSSGGELRLNRTASHLPNGRRSPAASAVLPHSVQANARISLINRLGPQLHTLSRPHQVQATARISLINR